jgi:PKD repeat protein
MKHFLYLKQIGLSLVLLTLTSCSLVSTLVDEGDPPIITELTISPTGGPAPLLSAVSWKIINTSKNPVTCTLDFGNGAMQTLEDCAQKTNVFYTYEKNGGFILVLTAKVGKHEVSRSLPVTVQTSTSPAPGGTAGISVLSVTPNDGLAPMLTNVKWQLTGLKDPVTCDLNFGDGAKETVTNCSQVNDTFHTYEKAGGYVLVLTAKDGEREVSKSLAVTVQAPELVGE